MNPTSSPVLFSANSSWNLLNFRAPIMKALLDRGYRVAAAVPSDQGSATLVRMGVEHHHLAIDARGVSPLHDVKLFTDYMNLLRRVRPSAFLPFTIKPNIYGSLAAARRQVPVLNTITGLGTSFLSGRALERIVTIIYRHALRNSSAVFFHNPDDLDLFLSMGLVRRCQGRIVAGSGVDLEHFSPAPEASDGSSPIFLFVGRLLKDKGAREFAESAAMLRDVPGARFQMLGSLENHPKALTRAELQPFIASGAIELLGEAADVRPFIRRAECVVLPSYREGLPRSILEASAMARPVIATDVPGCRHAIDDGLTGFLCKPRSAQSLADSMIRFLDLPPNDRRAMGVCGRRKVEAEFSDRQVVSAYLEALRVLVARNTPLAPTAAAAPSG